LDTDYNIKHAFNRLAKFRGDWRRDLRKLVLKKSSTAAKHKAVCIWTIVPGDLIINESIKIHLYSTML